MAKPIGRKKKNAAMVRAREIARTGESLGWTEVLRDLDAAAALSLKLWATADDVDELNRLCEEAKFGRRADIKLKTKSKKKR